LFEILDDVTISERKTDNLRMPVLDKVKEPAGYAISGKIESGFLKIGNY
jgi:translation elongation factor EF-1alpha